jgi:hypothetical protein
MREYLEGRGVVDYQRLRDNDSWTDHRVRAYVTAGVIAWLEPDTVFDPACGDGAIEKIVRHLWPLATFTLSDISEPNVEHVSRVFEEPHTVTLKDVAIAMEGAEASDVLVLTEILEHLEDPDSLLRLAHGQGHRWLIASSPEMRPGQVDDNPEHLWMFDTSGYAEMLRSAGWQPHTRTFLSLSHSSYDFGIWACQR